jgi:quinoprotein glucose dehydrogenase
VDAVAQITKLGYVYVFDRVTGEPLFPIREMPVAASDLPGEQAWPTQPIPEKPAPYARQVNSLTEETLSPYADNRAELATRLRGYHKGLFDPPSREGTVIFPGYDGGGEWGGAAADPQDGILYVNSNEMAWILTMVEAPKEGALSKLSPGEKIYSQTCAACHGASRGGNAVSGYPSLVNIGERRDRNFVTQMISNGKGMMPGFPALKAEEKQALVGFLFGEEKKEASGGSSAAKAFVPYRSTGYNKFLDNNGLPAIAPPWGTLNAIDLNTGEYLWKVPLGEIESLKQKGIANTGSENYGGPLVTASGLLFIAATKDGKFRAFDKKTGRLLWEITLPAAAFATPATYQINGKQYLVIACGGTKLGTKKGNKYVAFALP